MVVDAINPSIWEVEGGGPLCEASLLYIGSSRPSGQYSETLS